MMRDKLIESARRIQEGFEWFCLRDGVQDGTLLRDFFDRVYEHNSSQAFVYSSVEDIERQMEEAKSTQDFLSKEKARLISLFEENMLYSIGAFPKMNFWMNQVNEDHISLCHKYIDLGGGR